MKLLVLFYSTYGHVYRLAQAIADGAREVPGVDVVLKRVPETLSAEAIKSMGPLRRRRPLQVCPSPQSATWWTLVQSFSARRRGSGTWRARCGSFSTEPAVSGHKASSWAKLAACLSAPPPNMVPRVHHPEFPYDAASPRMVIVDCRMRSRVRCALMRSQAGRRMGRPQSLGAKASAWQVRTSLRPRDFRAGTWPRSRKSCRPSRQFHPYLVSRCLGVSN